MEETILSFSPFFGKKKDLVRVEQKDGQFIVTTDDPKIYLDAEGKRILIAQGKSSNDIIMGTFYVTNWSYNEKTGIYSQSITAQSVTGDYPLIVDLIISSDSDDGVLEQNDWGKITKIVAEEGKIIGYCYDSQPTIDLSFQAKEV